MNTTYAQQGSPPHDMHNIQRTSIPNISDAAYRSAAPGASQYPLAHSMPLPQQSQINPTYGDPFNPLAVSRAPIPEGMHAGEGLAPLAPGTAPQAPDPLPRSIVDKGKRYELKVVQQPRRARMCGFGDKDRRPITPPPCVRLIITDAITGKECDCNDIDHGMFVLNVDLWSADGYREVNLVRHSATSPSISASTPISYSEHAATSAAYSQILPSSGHFKVEPGQGHPGAPYNPYPGPPQVNPYAQPPGGQSYGGAPQYHQSYPPTTNSGSYPPQNGYSQGPPQPVYYTSGAGIHATGAGGQAPGMDYSAPHGQVANYGRPYTPADLAIPRMPVSSTAPQGMFTRNLIGSLAASAFRLTDPDDRIGIWFVLQDLSVRTEGTFRLRFSFVNVGIPGSPTSANPSAALPMTAVNTGRAPVLAACFSEVFTVYSAKRFPGVVESTNLSKCFATQGIKIPIRKDGPGKGDKNQDYDEE